MSQKQTFVVYTGKKEVIITTKENEAQVIKDWFGRFRNINEFQREEIKGAYAVLMER